MTTEHRYTLEPYKGMNTRYNCPGCGKLKLFSRYIDNETGEHLHPSVGRCNREVNCGYHYTPKQYFENNGIKNEFLHQYAHARAKRSGTGTPQKPISSIPVHVLKQTLIPEGYEHNIFIQNLFSRVSFPFEVQDVEKVISQYYLGTVCNGYRAGAITFPFIDKGGNVRAIQVKQFDETNHTTGTDFLHSIIEKHHINSNEVLPEWLDAYKRNEIKVSCLFGEHFLSKYTLNPIALVEAPKTAIYGTLYFGFPERPENLLWLAVYNLSSLNFDKCKALQGRDVFLFPDLSKDGKAFHLWSNKAKELSRIMPGTRFKVSDLLETLASNELKESGADIADILIKMDWRKFRQEQKNSKQGEQPKPETVTRVESEKGEKSDAPKQTYFSQSENVNYWEKIANEPPKRETWEQAIKELEIYFETATLPAGPVHLNIYSKITDVPFFIHSHLTILKANNGKRPFIPDLERLQELKQYLTNNSKQHENRQART